MGTLGIMILLFGQAAMIASKSIKEMLVHMDDEQIILDLVNQFNITKKLHPECLTALKMVEKGLMPNSKENAIAVYVLQDCGLLINIGLRKSGSG